MGIWAYDLRILFVGSWSRVCSIAIAESIVLFKP
nr:MAG TPA: hypothetical protein [Caudoviricetes sp.]